MLPSLDTRAVPVAQLAKLRRVLGDETHRVAVRLLADDDELAGDGQVVRRGHVCE
jgi:hypothetical protein